MKELYSKHKDRDPQGTVDGIVKMLEQAGLDTEMRWTSHPFEGLCSNRVTIAGTNIGTNGKGTSEQYCLASGYAEFMERLQNNILGSTALSGAEITHNARMSLFSPNAQRTKLFAASKPWESLTDGGRTPCADRSRCRSRLHQQTVRRAS